MIQIRLRTRAIRVVSVTLFAVAVAACGSSWPSALQPTASVPPAAASASTLPSTAPSTAAQSATPIAVTSADPGTGAMQIRFTNLTDGGSVAVVKEKGLTVVHVKVEVTGLAPVDVTMQANALPALDVTGHAVQALNKGRAVPFTGDLAWASVRIGGRVTCGVPVTVMWTVAVAKSLLSVMAVTTSV